MEVHFEKMAERRFAPQTMATDESPAMLVICLIRSLKNWFGQSSRTQTDGSQLQFGYELLDLPVQEFAETFGPLIYEIQQVWPVQAFGLGSQDELVGLSFPNDGKSAVVRQHSISGLWYNELRDLYLCIQFPEPQTAECMSRLLNAAEYDMEAVALEWKYADFLEQQKLCRIDHTLSFCYVILQEAEDQSRTGVYLSALTAQQKCQLWRTFLEKGLPQPEFEWLRNALLQGDIPNWLEWHLALYRVLEELGIRFLCRDGQFVLLDRQGKKLYFGIDHGNSAAQVLMKVLFPLRR